jgi:hypothetical protein
MIPSNFHSVLKAPDSVAHLDPDVVVEVLSRHSMNVSEAAGELGVASADLRKLLWARPDLSNAAVEMVERRLDVAEKNIIEALHSDDSRRRDAASFFVVRNTALARRRGWLTSNSSMIDVNVSASVQPRTVIYRWRTDDDDKRDAEAAEIERLREESKTVISIGWGDPESGKTIEHEASPESSNKD